MVDLVSKDAEKESQSEMEKVSLFPKLGKNKPCRYVPPRRVGVLRRFGLKTGIHFAHIGLESGIVFEGTTECMNVFIVSIPNE